MTINCRGKLLDLSVPKVMAICNITADSFYKKSRIHSESELINLTKVHLDNGASIIDIGGMSSRPGAKEIPVQDEVEKLKWALTILRREFSDLIVSIDTYRSEVVIRTVDMGVDMINDISGGMLDTHMIPTVGRLKLPYVLMHMKGKPETMQDNITDNKDIILNELEYFKKQISFCKMSGIEDVIIDPGFGFGKSLEDNYKILNGLSVLEIFDCPIMVGLSRKSMIYKVLDLDSVESLNGTTALHMITLINGANILRVHDTKEAHEVIQLFQKCKHTNQ